MTAEQGRARLALRRLWHHLTRSTARWAFALTAVSIAGYAAVPATWAIHDPVRQFLLVLASVAAGAMVLPELPSNLWSLDVERVRSLIPDRQRTDLARVLLEAESEDAAWTDVAWRNAVGPLRESARRPWSYVTNMDYDVMVHLGHRIEAEGATIDCHRVTVDSKSNRVLRRPGLGHDLWISIARTEVALGREFARPGCVARELVSVGDLSGEAWQQAVLEHCSAELFIRGEGIELTPRVDDDDPDVVRFVTASSVVGEGREPVRVMIDFILDAVVDTFPVMFAGYYCIGTTDLSFRVDFADRPVDLSCSEFIGRSMLAGTEPQTVERITDIYRQLVFTTGEASFLWPGSGVLYRWTAACS